MKKFDLAKAAAICLIFLTGTGLPYAQADDPVRIGLICPLTGHYGKEALSQKNFALLAAREINNAGGILGKKIEIVIEDTMLKPDQAVIKAEKLISQGVKYFIGGLYSSEVTAISQVASQNKVLHMGLGGSNTLTGIYCNKYHFNLCPAGYQMVRGLGNLVIDRLGLSKEWFTITVDYSWGHTTLDSVGKMLSAKGGTLVGNSYAALNETDFSASLVRALVSDARVLCIIVYGQHQAYLLQQIYDLGVKSKMDIVVIASNLGIITGLGPEVTENVYMGVPWYWNLEYPQTRELNQKYMDQYLEPGDWPGAQVYDSIHVIAAAIRNTGSFDPEKLIPEMEGMVFQTSKSSEKIRACDHRAIQDWYVGVGKSSIQRESKWDVLKILAGEGGEDLMDTCEETGCHMGKKGNH